MRLGRRIIVGLIAAIIVAALIIWRLTWVPPVWYNPPNARDEAAQVLADRVEHRLAEEFQKNRPAENRWSLRVQDSQINHWLALRLPKWAAHDAEFDWPENLGMPQVRIEHQAITVALPVIQDGGSTRTFVAQIIPTMADGRLHFKLDGLALGRISLPGEPLERLLSLANDSAPELLADADVQAALDLLAGRTSVEPVIELADGRHVRLLDFRLTEGALEFAAVTE